MSRYLVAGGALLACRDCGYELAVSWSPGDPPIPVPEHHGQPMFQLTHNDGRTPLWEACPGLSCCPPDQYAQPQEAPSAVGAPAQDVGVPSVLTGEGSIAPVTGDLGGGDR